MKTPSTLKEAIGRSISHNEIVLVFTADPREALANIDNDENVTDLDHSVENNGDLDVCGTRLGEDFRIRIRDEKSTGEEECASFESCDAPHPDAWSYKRCNRKKGHGGEHACIEYYSGRQNEWWKGES